MERKLYENIKINKLPNSEVEVSGEIPVNVSDTYKGKAIKKLGEGATVPGFRKGHIPEPILIKHLGETHVLEEVARLALADAYPAIIQEHTIDAIGSPQIAITKLAPGNPIEFKITSAVMPDVTLPNYTQIAKEETGKNSESAEVTDKEVDGAIENIRKQYASSQQKQDGSKAEVELPVLNDEFVKKLGDFKGVSDFKEKVSENMKKEKEWKAREKKRVSISDEIVKQSTIPLPEIFVESELSKMLAQFKGDIKQMGLEEKEYLKKINKTEEDLRKEWRADAEKRARLQLVLNKIAQEEKISAPKDEVDKAVNHFLEHHKDADKDRLRIYFESVITNEKVFQFLEGQK